MRKRYNGELHERIGFWWNGLTPSGRLIAVGYALRGLVISPAPSDHRCVMGSPVDDMVWCPRWTDTGRVWCDVHNDARTHGVLRNPGSSE